MAGQRGQRAKGSDEARVPLKANCGTKAVIPGGGMRVRGVKQGELRRE